MTHTSRISYKHLFILLTFLNTQILCGGDTGGTGGSGPLYPSMPTATPSAPPDGDFERPFTIPSSAPQGSGNAKLLAACSALYPVLASWRQLDTWQGAGSFALVYSLFGTWLVKHLPLLPEELKKNLACIGCGASWAAVLNALNRHYNRGSLLHVDNGWKVVGCYAALDSLIRVLAWGISPKSTETVQTEEQYQNSACERKSATPCKASSYASKGAQWAAKAVCALIIARLLEGPVAGR